MNNNRKLILYIAMSLDGYIAKQDGDISFLFEVEKEGEDYGHSAFLETVEPSLWVVKHTTKYFQWVLNGLMDQERFMFLPDHRSPIQEPSISIQEIYLI